MAEKKLPCGHPVGWMLRLRDGKELYKYCWGCLIEKVGLEQVFEERLVKKAPVVEAPVEELTTSNQYDDTNTTE